MPTLQAIRENGALVQPGERVVNFRGESWVLAYATRPTLPGKSGKVLVDNGVTRSEFYASVFGLTVQAW